MAEEIPSSPAPLLAALLCTTAISLAPNLLLYLFPTLTTADSKSNDPQALANTKYWLSLGQCLAAGGLLGDVFLHTLPHSVMDIYVHAQSEQGEEGHDHGHEDHHHHEHHGHSHDHHNHEFESQMMVLGLAILLGFTVFLVFDCIVRSFGAHHHHGEEKDKQAEKGQDWTLSLILSSPAILLNLAADSLHNFTDGIAIGASFATAASSIDLVQNETLLDQITTLLQSRGGLASLAIFLHEVPHELGDFSILLDSGMSQSKAIQVQFLTALAAYAGTFFGYGLLDVMKDGSYFGNVDVLVPFTAGGFIYLACGTILPGVLADEDEHENEEVSFKSKKQTSQFKNRIGQILAFSVGIGFMYLVGTLEHAGGDCCHGHLDLSLEDHTHDHAGHAHDSMHHYEVHNHDESHGHDEDHHDCDHDHDHHVFGHGLEQEL